MSLFYCQIVYSQQTVLNNNGDTLICSSVNEYSFLIKSVFKVKELTLLDSINNSIIIYQDTLISNKDTLIENQNLIIKNKNSIIYLKDSQLEILNNELIEQKKSTQKQKVQKWISIGVGSLFTILSTYIYVTK